jgi:soluble lytic murein transglycosylase
MVLLWSTVAAAKKPPSDPAAVRKLGEAYRAFRAGDYATAHRVTISITSARLHNLDYVWYLAGQSAFLDGDRAAALPLFQKVAASGGSRFRGVAAWRVADTLWELGRRPEAKKAYAKLLGKGGGEDAVALSRLGRDRQLALEHPSHPLAVEVPLSPADRITRAQALTRDREWDKALAELALVGDDVSPSLRIERDYWTGTTLFKMRRQYERAAQLLIAVHDKVGGRGPEALFHGARAYSRADKDDAAIEWYGKVVAKYPHTSQAAEAQFLAGWLEFNRGNYEASVPGLTATVEKYGRSAWADDARWYLGFAYFLLGDYAAALPHLDKIAARGGELDGGKGRYWKARTLIALRRPDEAKPILRGIVTAWPFSWYAQLARVRLKELGAPVGVFGDASPGAVPPFGKADEALASDPLIARADELIAAGLTVEAGDELSRGERGFIKKHKAARALPVLFDRYRRAQNFNRPWMLAVVYGGRALEQPPRGPARFWWEHAYPRAFAELVEKHKDIGDNPPHYLWSIMRKESGFNAHDVSYADAIGLLQMIPPTTKRMAEKVGLTYTDDLLYDPEKNIMVGSWYIGSLIAKFKRQIPIAAGSFNCGPRPVMRWLDQFGTRPMDEFVELVAYAQTREYMKKVTDNYARYLYLYEDEDWAVPLTVDPKYVVNDLEY